MRRPISEVGNPSSNRRFNISTRSGVQVISIDFPRMLWTPQSTPTKYGTTVVTPWQAVSISWSRGISIAAIAQDFREICRNALTASETGAPQPVEILTQIAFVIRLVKGDRKKLQRRVVIRFVAGLQRIHEDQSAAGSQYTPDIGHRRAADLGRQFAK